MQTKSPHSDSLSGQVAVVTGSTSGIGRSIALELARHGAHVMIHGRKSKLADQVLAELSEVGGPSQSGKVLQHTRYLADLAETATHAPFVAAAWDWAESIRAQTAEPLTAEPQTTESETRASAGVDIWVNNAGVDVLTGAAAELDFAAKLELLWQVDVLATIGLSRLVAARMNSGPLPSGTVLNIGWDQAEIGMAGDSGEMFATIKGAVMAFSRSFAKSCGPHVRVNCLAPGWIQTKWGDDTSEYWNDRAKGESLLGRWGTPTDVAALARFLVSPEAAFINAQTIAVNGGSQPWPVDWRSVEGQPTSPKSESAIGPANVDSKRAAADE